MEWEKELGKTLEEVIWDIPDSVGVLFSGGIDSSFLAYLVNRKDKGVHLYSSGTLGSHDYSWTKGAAELLGLPLKFFVRGEDEIMDGITTIKKMTGETSPMIILIELPLYFISKRSIDTVLLTGQGADELFLGYKKYEDRDTSAEDLRKVTEHIVPLERKISRAYGKELIYPYLDERVMRLAADIPREEKIRDGQRKFVLRSVASRQFLNEKIAWKEKKASQYSSGFKDEVARIARRQGKTVHELINDL